MFGVHFMFVFQSEHVLSEYINQWNYNSTLEPGVDKAWVYEEKKTILGFFLIIVFFKHMSGKSIQGREEQFKMHILYVREVVTHFILKVTT